MATTERMLEYYQKECSALLERCLKAEADRDINDNVYRIARDEANRANSQIKELDAKLKDAEDRITEYLAKIDLLEEVLEDHGITIVPEGEAEDAV